MKGRSVKRVFKLIIGVADDPKIAENSRKVVQK